jgi:hypothetical protein
MMVDHRPLCAHPSCPRAATQALADVAGRPGGHWCWEHAVGHRLGMAQASVAYDLYPIRPPRPRSPLL